MWVRPVARGVALGLALIVSAGLGAAIGSATGTNNDEWACPSDRIAYSVFTPSEGGGTATQAEALVSLAPLLAAEGTRSENEYAEAMSSEVGRDRFEGQSGRVFIDDRVEAQVGLARLDDDTWTVAHVRLCGGPVPPELASPYPTPDPR